MQLITFDFLKIDDKKDILHMSNAATLIFPNQLFKQHPAVTKSSVCYLIEEELFFNQFNFNKKKLLLHRASMQFYKSFLQEKRIPVEYIEANSKLCSVKALVEHLYEKKITTIHYADVVDDWLEKRLREAAKEYNVDLVKHATPCFLNTMEEANEYFDDQKTYFQTDFYKDQRRKRNLLLEDNGKPIGGKWTYDNENRLRFPKGEIVPEIILPKQNGYVAEAINYVEKNYSDNYGNTEPPFFKKDGFFPTTFDEAEKWLDDFMQHRFFKFGVYEDSMVKEQGVLYHSVLTPMLNTGLLTPQQVIDKALDAAVNYSIPLNSLEGFIRQIIGWREYIRIVYEREGSVQRTKNYWGFKRKISASFWRGNTGIHPVDVVIQKVLQSGYTHHIERLMVMGNFMLLCEFNPDEVYKWFMEMYIDAYDWVMVPNTYGMTQFADGGIMMTKPYISGSNYLMKMGNWQKGDWQQVWNGLFWRFMHVHRNFFIDNPRLSMLLRSFDKMPEAKQNEHLNNAENFLKILDADV